MACPSRAVTARAPRGRRCRSPQRCSLRAALGRASAPAPVWRGAPTPMPRLVGRSSPAGSTWTRSHHAPEDANWRDSSGHTPGSDRSPARHTLRRRWRARLQLPSRDDPLCAPANMPACQPLQTYAADALRAPACAAAPQQHPHTPLGVPRAGSLAPATLAAQPSPAPPRRRPRGSRPSRLTRPLRRLWRPTAILRIVIFIGRRFVKLLLGASVSWPVRRPTSAGPLGPRSCGGLRRGQWCFGRGLLRVLRCWARWRSACTGHCREGGAARSCAWRCPRECSSSRWGIGVAMNTLWCGTVPSPCGTVGVAKRRVGMKMLPCACSAVSRPPSSTRAAGVSGSGTSGAYGNVHLFGIDRLPYDRRCIGTRQWGSPRSRPCCYPALGSWLPPRLALGAV